MLKFWLINIRAYDKNDAHSVSTVSPLTQPNQNEHILCKNMKLQLLNENRTNHAPKPTADR
jgi:hypothetical protein